MSSGCRKKLKINNCYSSLLWRDFLPVRRIFLIDPRKFFIARDTDHLNILKSRYAVDPLSQHFPLPQCLHLPPSCLVVYLRKTVHVSNKRHIQGPIYRAVQDKILTNLVAFLTLYDLNYFFHQFYRLI